MYIKKKLIAISVVLAMAASFVACSDKGSGGSDNNNDGGGRSADREIVAETGTLSSEEFDELTKHDLTFEPFIPDGVQQDPVEGEENNNSVVGNISAGGNNSSDVGGNNSSSAGGNNSSSVGGNNNSSADNNSSSNDNVSSNNDSSVDNNSTPTNSTQPNGTTAIDIADNNVDIPKETGLKVISGTKAIMQAYWMDMSQFKDYVFDGEYLVANFKIKENAVDGIYPITIEWLGFTNWECEEVSFTGVDGAIVVGGEASENEFNDDNTPQVMASNISGKAGDTVQVTFNIKNNPGVTGNIFRFGYNCDALEYVSGSEGANFNGHFQ